MQTEYLMAQGNDQEKVPCTYHHGPVRRSRVVKKGVRRERVSAREAEVSRRREGVRGPKTGWGGGGREWVGGRAGQGNKGVLWCVCGWRWMGVICWDDRE